MPLKKKIVALLAKDKSLESWIWNASCFIRGAKDAPKYKDYILPLIFTKRLCAVFDDEIDSNRERLIEKIEGKLKSVSFEEELPTIHWMFD